jgi:hypothetical protein
MNQLLEQWLKEVADTRVHGTVREVVAERFAREVASLSSVRVVRYDTAYYEQRRVGWDAYVDVRGNRYSVPADLAGCAVTIRITFEDVLTVYHSGRWVAEHRLHPREHGWVTVPDHHTALWDETLAVEHRPLAIYEEVA